MHDRQRLLQRLEYSERRRSKLQRLLGDKDHEEFPFLWSMVDIMTLLLVFFVILYVSTLDRVDEEGKERFETAIKVEGPDRVLEQEIAVLLASNEAIDVRWDGTKPVFVLGEHITFEQGRADLIPDFGDSLGELARFIAGKKQYNVLVAGHTDNIPIRTSAFPSNWELSTARAISVMKFLSANGVAPGRIIVQGNAHYRPVRKNLTPSNRQANRRVEVSLVDVQVRT